MAIVLDTIVSDYLTSIKDALTTGADTGTPGAYAGVVSAAAQNYLRAQDLATALELLTDALDATTPLAATGGTVSTIIDGASTFVAGEQVGNTVTIVTATESIVGETAVVVSNDTTTLTVYPPFTATITAADTYTIEATFMDEAIAALRDGKGIADATPGNPYGSQKNAIEGLMLGIETVGAGSVVERNIGRAGLVAVAGSTDTVVLLSDSDYRIDQFKGMRVDVNTVGAGIAVSSNENSVTLRGPLPSAPAGGEAVTITVPVNDFGGTSAPKIVTHPGAQPGENAYLADLIAQFEAAVEAATVPS